jgi:hypothetical protein
MSRQPVAGNVTAVALDFVMAIVGAIAERTQQIKAGY